MVVLKPFFNIGNVFAVAHEIIGIGQGAIYYAASAGGANQRGKIDFYSVSNSAQGVGSGFLLIHLQLVERALEFSRGGAVAECVL